MSRLAFALIVAASLLGGFPARAESRLALVIGQSAYRSVPALTNPANDARAMAQALTDDGFEVTSASDLSETEMREQIAEFAGKLASKGPDTVALVFYAGHGLQIDGENYLIPVDVVPKREADIPFQAIRLNDLLNALTSSPNKIQRCSIGAVIAVTVVSFRAGGRRERDEGPENADLAVDERKSAVKEKGATIEDAFKHMRVAVNKTTGGRQTPWDSSSLTENFEFVPSPGSPSDGSKRPVARRTVDEWRSELNGKPVEQANEIVVADGTEESYEAFVGLYAQQPFSAQAREWLDRHRRMVAWNNAVIANTASSFHAFLAQYPDSDLTPTAQKLEQRLRNRPNPAQAVAAGAGGAATIVPAGAAGADTAKVASAPADTSQPTPACSCSEPAKKPEPPPKKRADTEPKRVERPVIRRAPSSGGYGGGGGSYGGYGRSGY